MVEVQWKYLENMCHVFRVSGLYQKAEVISFSLGDNFKNLKDMANTFIPIKDLEVYQLARMLSKMAWEIYSELNWKEQKIIGDQFIRSVDSVGANIAEGYARYFYLDKVRFYYYSRASLSEASDHWLDLMLERGIITKEQFSSFRGSCISLQIKLNNLITATKNSKK